MDLFKNPAIPVVFSGVGLIQVDCLTQVEIQLIKHLLNIYYLLSLTALQSIEEIKDTFPAIHSCGERGQHREQQEYTTEREHHWARRRHGSGLGSSKSFYPSTPHIRTIMKSPHRSVFMCVQVDVFPCTEAHF